MVLKRGSKGAEVKALQKQLLKLGYDLGSTGPDGDGADGDYGQKTESAVKHFQTFWGFTGAAVNGIADSATQDRLDRAMRYISSENKLVKAAANCIGISEPDGDDGIIRKFISITGIALSMTSPWCQAFVVVMQHAADLNPYPTASCTAAMNYYQDAGRWSSTPAVGTLVYLDWDLSGDADHVGIVAERDGGNIYVIEGNSAGEGEDAVRLKVYSETDKRIRGYAIVDALQVGTPATFTQAEFDAMMADWLQRHQLVVNVKS